MKKIINRDQQGFTIIELVIDNAKSHADNFDASVALAHSQWISVENKIL